VQCYVLPIFTQWGQSYGPKSRMTSRLIEFSRWWHGGRSLCLYDCRLVVGLTADFNCASYNCLYYYFTRKVQATLH